MRSGYDRHMDTKLLFQDAAGFQTPLLAVFAVDIAVGKDAEPLVALLTTSDSVADSVAKVLASGEFKATVGETLLLHGPNGLKTERLLVDLCARAGIVWAPPSSRASPARAVVRAEEVEHGHQVADRRPVARYVRARRRVRQVVLAVAGQRGQPPVSLDELQDRDVVGVGVVDEAGPRSSGTTPRSRCPAQRGWRRSRPAPPGGSCR